MRDNISIIFATIILTFLIVIMPLFSILDRQDTMSYNVVLSETTKFVDDVRSNGFLTQDAYLNYIQALATTGNTYKVVIEAYRKTLIPDGEGQYKEVRELYNTRDIEEIIYGEVADAEQKESNRRDNIFLFDINDEIYVHVYNTNTTAGTIMYNLLLTSVESKIIDITYGGMINNVNWELYTKLQSETIVHPTVVLSVPVNAEGSINVEQLVKEEDLANKTCATQNMTDLFAGVHELCTDITKEETYKYVYRLDKKNEVTGEYINQTIKLVARLDGINYIDVSTDKNSTSYTSLSQVTLADDIKKAIIEKYIRLNGMIADIAIDKLENKSGKYYIYITLTNVQRETTANISMIASVSILPGLGRDYGQRLSLGAESVKFELTVLGLEKEAAITGPYNWKKFVKTNLTESSLLTHVFADEEIFFKIHYNAINNITPEEVIEAIKAKITFTKGTTGLENNDNASMKERVTYYTESELKAMGLTIESDCIVIKLTYPLSEVEYYHRISLPANWIDGVKAINMDESKLLYIDTGRPNAPIVDFEGVIGKNNWYTSDVIIKAYATSDTGGSESPTISTGSGIYNSVLKVQDELGRELVPETDTDEEVKITLNGENKVLVSSVDYVGNYSTPQEYILKIDKEFPGAPKIDVSGTLSNGWYTSAVTVKIISGGDSVSGVEKTTYKVNELTGTNNILETSIGTNTSTTFTLDESGTYTIYATTYDNAGNYTTTVKEIRIDRGAPPTSRVEVISGLKHSDDNDWYYTDVRVRIHVNLTMADHKDTSKYELYKNGVKLVDKEEGTFKGIIKDLEITQGTGKYDLYIYTYTVSEVESRTKYVINIDKEGPKAPNVKINGTKGTMEWYRSNVTFELAETEANISYRYILTNKASKEKTENSITKGTEIPVTVDGEYTLRVIASDEAGNETAYETEIKIDKVAPTGELVVDGHSGLATMYEQDGVKYYNTPVYLSYKNLSDGTSGINRTDLNPQVILSDTLNAANKSAPKTVGMTVYDNAGNSTTYTKTLIVDMTSPTKGTIEVSGGHKGQLVTGVDTYSDNTISITLKPGEDDNIYQVTYRISGEDEGNKIERVQNIRDGQINEATYELDKDTRPDGIYTIYVETVDKAGNKSTETKVIWINRDKPDNVSILTVNATPITETTANLTDGNTIEVRFMPNLPSGEGIVKVELEKDGDSLEYQQALYNINRPVTYTTKTFDLTNYGKGIYTITITQIITKENNEEISSDPIIVTYKYN